ncbi:MAG: nucleotide-binding protein [Planctomycetaceae bacterium]|nr:nucleotide-binding protein [Planctomycetaceae bacterium]
MKRHLTPELMDDPALDPAEHRHALGGLARLNRISAAGRSPWRGMADLVRESNRPLSVLDVATGSGDVPISCARRAKAEGLELELHGCDLSEVALSQASQRARDAGLTMTCFQHDILAEPPPETYDVVTCNLFAHHLDEEGVCLLLRNMALAARRRLLLCDLRRDRIGLGLAWVFSRLLTRSKVVHVDAIKSVRAAWTPGEMRDLATRAGLENAALPSCFPRRMMLSWEPS